MSYHGAERMPGLSHEETKRLDASGLYGLSGQDLDDFLAEADNEVSSKEAPKIEQSDKRRLTEEPLIL